MAPSSIRRDPSDNIPEGREVDRGLCAGWYSPLLVHGFRMHQGPVHRVAAQFHRHDRLILEAIGAKGCRGRCDHRGVGKILPRIPTQRNRHQHDGVSG